MKKLKRGILVTAVMMAMCTMGMAQAQLALGVKGGLNFAKLDVEDFSTKSRTGFHGGAFALFKFTKIGIQPEILFSQQGTKFKFDGRDLESNYSYMNIPVMVKLYTVAGLNLQVGPQFGFVMNAEQDQLDTDTGDITTEDIKDELKGSDVSLALGVGWDLPFGLTVDGRYNLGLSDINDSAAEGAIKNQVWQISVGYKLFKFGN